MGLEGRQRTHKLIDRPHYLSQLLGHKDKDLVKIITGVRRCGKSTLLALFRRHLLDTGTDAANIISMNLESGRWRDLATWDTLYDSVASRIAQRGPTYLLFDEIQVVSQWQRAIESLRLDFDVDVYITGSNAHMLSGELATLLSSRYVQISMLPLSFQEFLQFHGSDPGYSVEELFQKYLQFGGMPVLGEYSLDSERSEQVLEGIYSTVILKDVLARGSLDADTLNRIVLFLCSNVGSITSPASIAHALSSAQRASSGSRGIADKTVEKYLALLRDAFVFYPVRRYDIRGKQFLKTLGKDYIVDTGIRNMLLGYRDADYGHMLENVVYLELLRRGSRVCIGRIGDTEVDFVAETPNQRVYVQVAQTLLGEETLQRELRPLDAIGDNYEKIILSMDRPVATDFGGIRIVNVIDWLLGRT